MSNPYSTLDSCVRHLRVLLPTPRLDWRLVTDPVAGQINGIPALRGTAIATNGIMVLLVNELGVPFLGHLEWFIPDDLKGHMSDLYDEAPKHKTKLQKFQEDYTTW